MLPPGEDSVRTPHPVPSSPLPSNFPKRTPSSAKFAPAAFEHLSGYNQAPFASNGGYGDTGAVARRRSPVEAGASAGDLTRKMNGNPAKQRFRLDMDLGGSDSDSSSEEGGIHRGASSGGGRGLHKHRQGDSRTPALEQGSSMAGRSGFANSFREVAQGVDSERRAGVVAGRRERHKTPVRDTGCEPRWHDVSGRGGRKRARAWSPRASAGNGIHSSENTSSSKNTSSSRRNNSGGGARLRYLDGDADSVGCSRDGKETIEGRDEQNQFVHGQSQQWSQPPLVTPEHADDSTGPPGAPGRQPNTRPTFVARNPYKQSAVPLDAPEGRGRDVPDRPQPAGRNGEGGARGVGRAPSTAGNRSISSASSSSVSPQGVAAGVGSFSGGGDVDMDGAGHGASSLRQMPSTTVAVQDVYPPELSR